MCFFTWLRLIHFICLTSTLRKTQVNLSRNSCQPRPLPASITCAGSRSTVRHTKPKFARCAVTRLLQWFCFNTPPLTFLATAKNEMFAPVTLSAVCQGGISPQLCFPGNLLDRFSVRRGALSYNLFWFVLCLFFLIAGIVTIWQIYLV